MAILIPKHKLYSFYKSTLDLGIRSENIFLNKFLFYKACPKVFLSQLKLINCRLYEVLDSIYASNNINPAKELIAKQPKYFSFIFLFCNHICEFDLAHDVLSITVNNENLSNTKLITKIVLDSFNQKFDDCERSLLFLKSLYSSFKDNNYSNLLLDKSLTVVGSGKADLTNINSDYLIFFNPVNKILKNHNIIGYYRGEYTQNIIDNNIRICDLDLKYYNFKDKKQLSCVNTVPKRQSSPTSNLSSIGSLNGVQDVCIDLIVNDILSVNVTGVNFLLLSTTREGYRPSNLTDVEYNKTFGIHPPLTQFLVLKAFYMIGYVIPDKSLELLLKLSPCEFSNNYQNRWGRL